MEKTQIGILTRKSDRGFRIKTSPRKSKTVVFCNKNQDTKTKNKQTNRMGETQSKDWWTKTETGRIKFNTWVDAPPPVHVHWPKTVKEAEIRVRTMKSLGYREIAPTPQSDIPGIIQFLTPNEYAREVVIWPYVDKEKKRKKKKKKKRKRRHHSEQPEVHNLFHVPLRANTVSNNSLYPPLPSAPSFPSNGDGGNEDMSVCVGYV